MKLLRPLVLVAVSFGTITGVTMILNGCFKPDQNPVPPTRVALTSLVRDYRDSPGLAESTWTGQKLLITLPAKGYKISLGEIHWFTGLPESLPVIVFECGDPPVNNERDIEIIGICRGRVWDSKHRGPGIDWYIKIESCTLILTR